MIGELFTEWPFSVVPERGRPIVWAGRPSVRERAEGLIRSFSYRPQSTLDLLWAAFGSGKTHFLYYLEAMGTRDDTILPWYAVAPSSPAKFDEVFLTLMQSFPLDVLANSPTILKQESELSPVLRALRLGTEEQRSLARAWLLGSKVDMRTAPRLISSPYKVDGIRSMHRLLAELLKLAIMDGRRVLLLLDEYQRALGYRGSAQRDLNSMMLDLFNQLPTGFSVVFSCSAVQEDAAARVLSDEVRDRMRGRETLRLPTMDRAEARTFLEGLIMARRPPGYAGPTWAPFSEELLDGIATGVAQAAELQVIPRHLIQVCDVTMGRLLDRGRTEATEEDISTAIALVAGTPA